MAIKYYETTFDRMKDEEFNNSPDRGITKKDIKWWIEYIMREENETSP